MEVKLVYKGEVKISVSTTLTLVVPFSKEPKTWPMGLTIRVKDLEGDLLVMLKKPPSARLWYGFREMPKVSIVSLSVSFRSVFGKQTRTDDLLFRLRTQFIRVSFPSSAR